MAVKKKIIPRKVGKKKADKKNQKIVITAALPYANGPIHIGHLLEYIQADIYTRFLKLSGKEPLYICASDMHGTPIEINARKAGKSPEKFVEEYWHEHQHDFSNFLIKFDNYYKTHSPENKQLAEYFFAELKKKNLIYRKKVQIIYCPHCQRALPDRFVKGTCPHCATSDQYGDICESCSSALKGIDLVNPKCVLCTHTPIQKESEHYFFKLSKFSAQLKKWYTDKKSWIQPEVKNWLQGWLEKGLDDWGISRDGPYFGFEIPEAEKETGEKKFFYVWLDAPIGYISSTKNYCQKHGQKWEDYWQKGSVYHFIGKDIAYFHFLFWPAMLLAVGIPLPKLTVHGFITVNGEKMSKSRGTFFTAKDFLKMYSPETLRFYYAYHLDRQVIDVDLNFASLQAVNNNVLVGNLGNFCYRILTFAQKNYGAVKEIAAEKELISMIKKLISEIEENYLALDYKNAVKNILKISDLGNAYFQKAEVWKNKDDQKSRAVVGFCANLTRNLSILVQPILPLFAEKVWKNLGEKELSWKDLNFKWKGKLLEVPLLVEKMEHLPNAEKFPLHLVVGKIISVKNHPDADSLYVLQVDLGKWGRRQVVAGLKKYLASDQLLNRQVVFCANMKPAKLRGELSEAMVLAGDDHEKVSLLEAEKTALGEEVIFNGLENSHAEVTFEDFKKLVLEVKNGQVFYQNKKLITKTEEIKVHGLKDGARVY